MITLNDDGSINFPYSAPVLTEVLNQIPNQYGRIEELKLSPAKPIDQTVVSIRLTEGQLRVLSAKERGDAGQSLSEATGSSVLIEVPHFPDLHVITPDDIQGMINATKFGMEPKTFEDAFNEHLGNVRFNHDVTRNYMQMGALKGVLLDGAGTQLLDLYDTFDIVKVTVNFELSIPGTDVFAKCAGVVDRVKKSLKGQVMTGLHAFVASDFYHKLITHPNVEKYYLNHAKAVELTGAGTLDQFSFGGILFEKVTDVVPGANGTTLDIVADGYGHAFPMGTRDVFSTYDAPPHALSMANKPGLAIYTTIKILDHDMGVELKSQSNPLAVWKRPDLLTEFLMG